MVIGCKLCAQASISAQLSRCHEEVFWSRTSNGTQNYQNHEQLCFLQFLKNISQREWLCCVQVRWFCLPYFCFCRSHELCVSNRQPVDCAFPFHEELNQNHIEEGKSASYRTVSLESKRSPRIASRNVSTTCRWLFRSE